MHALRLAWQGHTREQTLLRQCELALARWHAEWFGETTSWRPSLRIQHERPDSAAARWRNFSRGDTCLLMATNGDDFDREIAGRALVLSSHAGSHGFFESVGTACMKALASRLCNADDSALAEVRVDAPSAESASARHGGIGMLLEGLPRPLWLHFNPSLCEQQMPSPPSRHAALTPRMQAIAQTRVSIRARIELGEVALADSVGWRVGEVLITDEARQARTFLSLDEQPVAKGQLQITPDGSRAIALAAPRQSTPSPSQKHAG